MLCSFDVYAYVVVIMLMLCCAGLLCCLYGVGV